MQDLSLRISSFYGEEGLEYRVFSTSNPGYLAQGKDVEKLIDEVKKEEAKKLKERSS